MSAPSEDQARPRPAPPQPARAVAPPTPVPAKHEGTPGEREGGRRRDRGRGRSRSKRGRGRGGKPTPVRELASTPPAVEVEADLAQATVRTEEGPHSVRVVGRSGRSTRSAVPLLLLGFWPEESTDEEPPREALVVGKLLSDLTEFQLEAAFRRSRAPLDPERPRRFFGDTNERRRS